LEALVVTPGLLEQLLEMGLAVRHSFERGIVAQGEGGLAVLALEAGAVEGDAVGGELVHRVHRLGAHLALLLRPAKHLLPIAGQPPSFSLSLSRVVAAGRDLTESPIRPWPARAWRGMDEE